MKLPHYLLAGWALMAGLTGCKHDNEPIPSVEPPVEQPGAVTDVGQPQGEAISKTIGPEGGSLSSADGTVQLTLPAGALSKATTLTIQPITNQAPNGLGVAYRFLPDGTQFARPATLTFHYDASAVAANDPDLLQVAFQGTDRSWYRVPGVSVDTTNRQITVPMPHFSDWTAYEIAEIEQLDITGGPNLGAYLDFGASTNLAVNYAWLVPLVPNNTSKPLAIKSIRWSVSGGAGNGQIKADGDRATYTAPNSYPPQNPVTVVAEVTFTDSDKKVLLLTRILVGKDYFTGTFGGVPFNWVTLSYNRVGNVLHLAGWNEAETQSLNVSLSPRNSTNPKGSYAYKADIPKNGDGTAFVEYALAYGGMDGYLSYMYPCGDGRTSPPPIISPGQVTITQVDVVDGVEYIKGHISATLYNLPAPCPTPLINKSLQAEFRIKQSR